MLCQAQQAYRVRKVQWVIEVESQQQVMIFWGEEQSLEHVSENEDEEVASNQLHTSRFWDVHTHTLRSRKS